MDPFTTFNSGQPLKVSAELHRILVRMAQWWIGQQRSDQKATKSGIPVEGKLRIVNISGAVRDQFNIVALGNKIIGPSGADSSAFGDKVFDSATPDATMPFAILQEPAGQNSLAPALMSGLSWVKIDLTDATHTHALPIDDDYEKLASSADPTSCEILWADSPAAAHIAGGISDTDPTLTVDSSEGFPAPPFVVTIESEQLNVTAIVGEDWTVTRGFNGTTAASHADAIDITIASKIVWALVRLSGTSGGAEGPTIQIMSAAPVETTADGTIYDVIDLGRDNATETFTDGEPCWFLDLRGSTSQVVGTRYIAHELGREAHGQVFINTSAGLVPVSGDINSLTTWAFNSHPEDEVVDYSGQFWKANTDTIGEPGVSADWDAVAAWAAGSYSANQTVTNSGAVWTCLTATAEEPNIGAIDWMQEVDDPWVLVGELSYPGNVKLYSSSTWTFTGLIPSTGEPGVSADWTETPTITDVGAVDSGAMLGVGDYGRVTRRTLDGRTDCCDEDVDDDINNCGCAIGCDTVAVGEMLFEYIAEPYSLSSAQSSELVIDADSLGNFRAIENRYLGVGASAVFETSFDRTLLQSFVQPNFEHMPVTALIECYAPGGSAHAFHEQTSGLDPAFFYYDYAVPCGGASGGCYCASLLILDNPPYTVRFDPTSNSVQMKDGSNTVVFQAASGNSIFSVDGTSPPGAPAPLASDCIAQLIHPGGAGGNPALIPYALPGGGGGGGGPDRSGSSGRTATIDDINHPSNFNIGGIGGGGLATDGGAGMAAGQSGGVNGGADGNEGVAQFGSRLQFSNNSRGLFRVSLGSCAVLPVPIPPGPGDGLSPTVNTANTLLPLTGTTLVITGTNFNTTAGNNTVALSGGATGTVTSVNAAGTQATITLSGQAIGPLTLILTDTISSLSSTLPVTVANVVATVTLNDTSATQTTSNTATQLTLTGSGFTGSASSMTVTLNFGATGHVSTSTLTSLVVVLDTPPTGYTEGDFLTATVTVNGVSSTTENVATLTYVIPTITLNTGNVDYLAPFILVDGTGFDAGTPGNNVVTLSNGALATVTAATSTQLTVTFDQQPTINGTMTAQVSVNGISSAIPVIIATITAIPFITPGAVTIPWNTPTFDIFGGNFFTGAGFAGNPGMLIVLALDALGATNFPVRTFGVSPTSATITRNYPAGNGPFLPNAPGTDLYAIAVNNGAGFGQSAWTKIGTIGAASVAIVHDAFGGTNGTLLSPHNPDVMPPGFVYGSIMATAQLELQGGKAVGSAYETLAGDDWSGVSFDSGAPEATVSIDIRFVPLAFTDTLLFCRYVPGTNPQGYAVRVGAQNSGYASDITIERWDGAGGMVDLVSAGVLLVDGNTYTLTLQNQAGVMTAAINGVSVQWTATEWNTVTVWGFAYVELVSGGAVHTAAAFDELTVNVP